MSALTEKLKAISAEKAKIKAGINALEPSVTAKNAISTFAVALAAVKSDSDEIKRKAEALVGSAPASETKTGALEAASVTSAIRAAIGSGSDARIVTYLQSGGSCYVDTGLTPTATSSLDVMVSYLTSGYALGAGERAKSIDMLLRQATYYQAATTDCGATTQSTFRAATFVPVVVHLGDTFEIDGNVVNEYPGRTGYGKNTLGLFAWHNGTGWSDMAKCRIHAARMSDGGAVADLIPFMDSAGGGFAKRTEEGITILRNLGTGSFTSGETVSSAEDVEAAQSQWWFGISPSDDDAGEDELPDGAYYVDWLKGDGVAAVDTGYVLDGSETVEITYKVDTSEGLGSKAIWGSAVPVRCWLTTGYVRFNGENIFNISTKYSTDWTTCAVSRTAATCGGSSINRNSTADWSAMTGSVYVFGCNGRMDINSKAYVSAFKIIKNGNPVVDMVPAAKEVDGVTVGYMYDKVANSLRGNVAASGALSVGPQKA